MKIWGGLEFFTGERTTRSEVNKNLKNNWKGSFFSLPNSNSTFDVNVQCGQSRYSRDHVLQIFALEKDVQKRVRSTDHDENVTKAIGRVRKMETLAKKIPVPN